MIGLFYALIGVIAIILILALKNSKDKQEGQENSSSVLSPFDKKKSENLSEKEILLAMLEKQSKIHFWIQLWSIIYIVSAVFGILFLLVKMS